MPNTQTRRTILIADDDAEDVLLVRDALQTIGGPFELRFVRDGEDLIDYLRHRGEYEEGRDVPRPDLILLDLKMPRKDGRETIRELKSDPKLRRIPVVALTTSTAGDDVEASYDIGVNSYVTKPATYRELVDLLKSLCKYWFEVVELPSRSRHERKSH